MAVSLRPATSEPTTEQKKHIPGEAGVWVFIFGDLSIFAACFLAFVVRRSAEKQVFTDSQARLHANLGATNTLVLLVSSLLVVLAGRAVSSAAYRHKAPRLLLGAMACGVTFIVIKVFEYSHTFSDGITPATNDFYSYYIVLTGLHLFHVVLGLVFLTILWRFSLRPEMSPSRRTFFEGASCFWHMVDLLWIVLFPLIFLVR